MLGHQRSTGVVVAACFLRLESDARNIQICVGMQISVHANCMKAAVCLRVCRRRVALSGINNADLSLSCLTRGALIIDQKEQ